MKKLFRMMIAAVLALTMLCSAASALTVEQALDLLEEYYLHDVPERAYEAEDLETLLELLGDPYTVYMNEEEYSAFLGNVEDTVDLVGVGVQIRYTEEGILVEELVKGGSAASIGIQPGDLIVAVDGVSCVPAGEEHRDLIMGEEGTRVMLTVRRKNAETKYLVERRRVFIPNTEFTRPKDGICYIECRSFGSDTGNLIVQGLERYDELTECWVLDLRSNTGGYTQAALDMMGALAGPGKYIYMKNHDGNYYYYSTDQEACTTDPVVVLVDGNSASAAEIVSAGVRDLGLGILVGERTYGKGVAQMVYNGVSHPEYFEKDALKITTSKFYSPLGFSNHNVGVIPTLMVPGEQAYDVAMALCAGLEDSETSRWALLHLNGIILPLDFDHIAPETMSVIFEALPPTATLWTKGEGGTVSLTVPEAADWFGVEYSSRWFNDVEESKFGTAINILATYGLLENDGSGSFDPKGTVTRGQLCALLAKCMNLTAQGSNYFTDVTDDYPCASAINAVFEAGIISGMGDGTFHPDRLMCEEEFWVILGRLIKGLSINCDYTAGQLTPEELGVVADMGYHSWSCEAIALLEKVGILTFTTEEEEEGDVDGEPGSLLREEAAYGLYVVLLRSGILD